MEFYAVLDQIIDLLRQRRGRVWLLLRKHDAAIADFQRMRQMAHASGQPRQEGESLCHLEVAYYDKPSDDPHPLAKQYAQETQQLAPRLGEAPRAFSGVALRKGQRYNAICMSSTLPRPDTLYACGRMSR